MTVQKAASAAFLLIAFAMTVRELRDRGRHHRARHQPRFVLNYGVDRR
jgi:hypothetical protein